MSDDIVTRLRNTGIVALTQEAIAEIERLRQLADNLYQTLQDYPCRCDLTHCKCGYDDMMDEYKAVRGE